jgi:hypothetical protein
MIASFVDVAVVVCYRLSSRLVHDHPVVRFIQIARPTAVVDRPRRTL